MQVLHCPWLCAPFVRVRGVWPVGAVHEMGMVLVAVLHLVQQSRLHIGHLGSLLPSQQGKGNAVVAV